MLTRKSIVLLLAVGIGVSACGGASDGNPLTTTTTIGSAPTTPPPDPDPTSTADGAEAPDLTGSWNVTHIFSEEFSGPTNVWPGTEVSLELEADGTLSGNAGCNDYTGRYQVSGAYETESGFDNVLGQAMEISDLSWTERACDDENTMTQEVEYFQALQRVEQWWIGQGFGGENDLILTSLEDGLMVEGSRN